MIVLQLSQSQLSRANIKYYHHGVIGADGVPVWQGGRISLIAIIGENAEQEVGITNQLL